METLHTFSDTAAENQVESRFDTQVEVNAKTLDYQINDREAEVKVDKVSDENEMMHW